MTRRTNRTYRKTAVIGALFVLLLALWVSPALAVKAVKTNSQQVETDKSNKNTAKDPDSNKSGTTTLLNDIESQKTRGGSADSSGYDRWIDRNGDGVNDNMESSKTRSATKTRVKQPDPTPQIQAVPDTQQKKTDDDKSDTTKSKRRR